MVHSVEGYTSKDLIVVSWLSPVSEAQGLMAQSRVRHLPVVDDRGVIVGIVSERDLKTPMQGVEVDPTLRVVDRMSWPVEAIDEESSLTDAARAMIDGKISALIVTRGTNAVGIVTSEDLLKALLDASVGPFEKIKAELQTPWLDSRIGAIAQAFANIGV
jgi:acetoin utilization protein AcuB